jgi:hypothetical protein
VKVSEIEIGKTYEVAFPFVRDTYDAYDADSEGVSAYKAPTWRPGVDYEMCAPDDTEAVADGVGKMLLSVVSVHHLPKPYAARVFFVREWINPDGKRFGKKQLRIMGGAAFIHRASGYWLEYRMRELDTEAV